MYLQWCKYRFCFCLSLFWLGPFGGSPAPKETQGYQNNAESDPRVTTQPKKCTQNRVETNPRKWHKYRSIDWSVHRWIKQSINQSINRSVNQSINQSFDQSIKSRGLSLFAFCSNLTAALYLASQTHYTIFWFISTHAQ